MRTADRLANILLRKAREAKTEEEARVYSDLAYYTFSPNTTQERVMVHLKDQKALCESRKAQMVVLDPRGNFVFVDSSSKALAAVEKEEGCYLDYICEGGGFVV